MRNWFRYVSYLILAVGFSAAKAGAYEDFFRAVATDNASTVQSLLERGFDPNSRDEKGQSPLYIAMREGNFKVGGTLLANPQTRVDLPNAAGETALMMAALKGHVDWIGRLLDKGARVDGLERGERPGWTPLHYAASGPDAKSVELLLSRGAKVDVRSPNGTTPLMMAAQYGPEDAVRLLLQNGADATARNDLKLEAADFAGKAGRETLARQLRR
jgi:ankyrin repeat protein